MAKHEKVDVPSSNMREGIAKVLQGAGYIRSFKVVKDGKQGMMRVYLRYNKEGQPTIKKIIRLSKPSRRTYVKASEVPQVRSGYGLAVLSTNKGVLSGEDATSNNVGGELLCKVW